MIINNTVDRRYITIERKRVKKEKLFYERNDVRWVLDVTMGNRHILKETFYFRKKLFSQKLKYYFLSKKNEVIPTLIFWTKFF